MAPRVLYVTDLTYEARGRRYCDEDIALSAQLREHFAVALCHPLDAVSLMDAVDVVVIRNSGPVIHYRDAFDRFRSTALERGAAVFTELTGRGDQRGKRYLAELYADGFPVIPTVTSLDALDLLPAAPRYAVKPVLGADSVGLEFLAREQLTAGPRPDVLIQPQIAFRYEVSFYFVDRSFQYALYAPDPDVRWGLETYEAGAADLAFAQRFVDWNTVDHGIQRVDACRTADGDLLLVELEDLNPYLSLDVLPDTRRAAFVDAMVSSIERLARGAR